MVIDFEHHYVPIELARRMGINTETRSIVEEDGVAKANVHAQLFDLDAQIQDMDRAGIDVAVQNVFWDGIRRWKIAGCSTTVRGKFKKNIVGASSAWPIFRRSRASRL